MSPPKQRSSDTTAANEDKGGGEGERPPPTLDKAYNVEIEIDPLEAALRKTGMFTKNGSNK